MLVVAVVSVVACSKKSEKSEQAAKTETGSATQPAAGGQSNAAPAPSGKESGMQTYTLNSTGGDPIKVTVASPSNWTPDTSDADSPSFKVAGLEGGDMVSITAISPRAADATERLAKAIRMQFEEGPNVKREDLSDGRAWVSEVNDRNAHGRIFVPTDDGVVMGVAMLSKERANQLPEIRKVFETIKVVK
jgi:hypothetical protein